LNYKEDSGSWRIFIYGSFTALNHSGSSLLFFATDQPISKSKQICKNNYF